MRGEARLVGPVLDEAAGRPVAGAVEQGGVVGAEPGEEGEVLAAGDDVDAVDLDDADAVDDPLDVPHPGTPRSGHRVGETLCGERDSARLGLRQPTSRHQPWRGSMRFCWTAYIAASIRVCSWSFSRMLRT